MLSVTLTDRGELDAAEARAPRRGIPLRRILGQ